MNRILRLMAILTLCVVIFLCGSVDANDEMGYVVPDAEVEMVEYIPDAEVRMVASKPAPKKKKPKIVKESKPGVSEKEIKLLALLCMAEAEGESEQGKRLVIDTVLNRVDSKHFPNTITGVIYQKNQFTSMWNGRVNRCYVKKDIYKLVKEELRKRTNSTVMFFTAGQYGNYGTPMFRVGNHYFSKY